MTKDAPKSLPPPNRRELDLIEMLRENPALMSHIEELAQMTRNPDDLLKSGHQAEEKVIDRARGIGKSGLQKWAEAANENCESQTQEIRAKGQCRHGKKNSTG